MGVKVGLWVAEGWRKQERGKEMGIGRRDHHWKGCQEGCRRCKGLASFVCK